MRNHPPTRAKARLRHPANHPMRAICLRRTMVGRLPARDTHRQREWLAWGHMVVLAHIASARLRRHMEVPSEVHMLTCNVKTSSTAHSANAAAHPHMRRILLRVMSMLSRVSLAQRDWVARLPHILCRHEATKGRHFLLCHRRLRQQGTRTTRHAHLASTMRATRVRASYRIRSGVASVGRASVATSGTRRRARRTRRSGSSRWRTSNCAPFLPAVFHGLAVSSTHLLLRTDTERTALSFYLYCPAKRDARPSSSRRPFLAPSPPPLLLFGRPYRISLYILCCCSIVSCALTVFAVLSVVACCCAFSRMLIMGMIQRRLSLRWCTWWCHA